MRTVLDFDLRRLALRTVCLVPLDYAARMAAVEQSLRDLRAALNSRKDLH